MKIVPFLFVRLFALLVLLLGLFACQSPTPTPSPTRTPAPTREPQALGLPAPPATFEASLKGWELYSWPDGDEWKFVIVPGTNRVKSEQEILAYQPAIGPEGSQRRLIQVQRGEEIFWMAPAGTVFRIPPPTIVNQLEAFAASQGVRLSVAQP